MQSPFFSCWTRLPLLTDQSIPSVKEEIENVIAEAAKKIGVSDYAVEYVGFAAEGCVLIPDDVPPHPMISTLMDAHQTALGHPIRPVPATCTTDCRFYHLYRGIPSTCFGPEASSIHGIDESVSLKSVSECAIVYALFMARWCGVQKIN